MWILNFAIATVNILPIYPLDGGLMVEAIAEKICKKYAKNITMVITIISLAVFIINFATPFLLK
jgi:membrane-associated protease RseP (regulator of RpoE activity)